jgi:ribulose-5-phosphate 4-epimerase/fuculose-1-phosphate aldolase
VLVCANHGVVVVGASLSEAMEDLYYFERAAVRALQGV